MSYQVAQNMTNVSQTLLQKILSANNVDFSITATGADSQTNSYAVVKPITYVTAGNQAARAGVRLPSASTADSVFYIFNLITAAPTAGANATGILVYPNYSETILPLAQNAFDILPSGMGSMYVSLGSGRWRPAPFMLKNDNTSNVFGGYTTFAQPVQFSNAIRWTNVSNTITAFAGGGQASAVALASGQNRVTVCATNGDSVKLPSAVLGDFVMVSNNTSNTVALFPASGDAINGAAADASVNLNANKAAFCTAIDATNWLVTGV